MANWKVFSGIFAACLMVSGCTKAELEKHLQARLDSGELGGTQCAALSVNFRAVDQGFDDIHYQWLPGAHRVVIAKGRMGWRMVWGAPELALFTREGFFTMSQTTFTAPDGTVIPAREYRLTRKGYEAMASSGRPCFEYQSSGGSVEVVSVTQVPVPSRLSSLGEAFRVKFRVHSGAVAGWADTPEFRYVYSKIYTTTNPAAPLRDSERVFFRSNGRWLGEHEATMELSLAAAALRAPQAADRIEERQAKIAAETPEKKAARIAGLTPSRLLAMLNYEMHRRQIAPCFDLPARDADATRGIWKAEGRPSFVFYEVSPARGPRPGRDGALEMMRRMEKAGLAKAVPFEKEPFPGARAGKGTSYVLSDEAARALKPGSTCLPLGDAKAEGARLVRPSDARGVGLRGWARLAEARPWTSALAEHFPHVRAIVEQGYGVTGTVQFTSEAEMLKLRADLPRFALKPPLRYINTNGVPVAIDGPAVADQSADGVVRMKLESCSISEDGTEVSAGKISCGGARATRGYRGGKAYAEIQFRAKQKGGHPDTWTNAAVTSKRFLGSVSTGAASFSFAGTYTKNQIRDGDVIGAALDLDEQVLYWHLNGEWKTGRPGSGIGEPLIDAGEEYFIAVSVQDKAEAWKVNFGASSFRYPPPAGFPPYGAPVPR